MKHNRSEVLRSIYAVPQQCQMNFKFTTVMKCFVDILRLKFLENVDTAQGVTE